MDEGMLEAAERRAKNDERNAQGRCVACRRPVLPSEGRRCPRCERVAVKARKRWTKSEAGQAWNRKYAADRYADRKARGVCIRRETPAAPGRITIVPTFFVNIERWLDTLRTFLVRRN